jgi:hypothetical protein
MIEGGGWWFSNASTCEQGNISDVKYVKDRKSRIIRDAGNLRCVSCQGHGGENHRRRPPKDARDVRDIGKRTVGDYMKSPLEGQAQCVLGRIRKTACCSG